MRETRKSLERVLCEARQGPDIFKYALTQCPHVSNKRDGCEARRRRWDGSVLGSAEGQGETHHRPHTPCSRRKKLTWCGRLLPKGLPRRLTCMISSDRGQHQRTSAAGRLCRFAQQFKLSDGSRFLITRADPRLTSLSFCTTGRETTHAIATTFAAVDQWQPQELQPAPCFPDSGGPVASSRSMDVASARSGCRGEHSRPRFAANPLPSTSACLARHNSHCSAAGRPAANSHLRSTLCHSSNRS